MTAPTFFTVIADYKSVVVDLASDVDADPQLGPITAKVTFTPILASGDVILATTASPRPTGYVAAPIVARIDTDGRLKLRVDPDGDIDIFANTAAFPATGLTAKVYFSIANQTYYRWTGSAYAETYPYAAVRLLADTALLELDSPLYYRVTFSEVVFNGASGYIAPFVFEAPSTDTELNLIEVTPVPGTPASGQTKIAPGGVRLEDGEIVFSFAGVDLDDPIPFEPSFDVAEISDSGVIGRELVQAETAASARATLGATTTGSSLLIAASATAARAAISAERQRVFNVKDYGAVGDGVANDRAAIHAARDAAGVGGTLFFPPGTYRVEMAGAGSTGYKFFSGGLHANVADQTWLLGSAELVLIGAGRESLIAISAPNVSIIGGTLDLSTIADAEFWNAAISVLSGEVAAGVVYGGHGTNAAGAVIRDVTINDAPSQCVHVFNTNSVTVTGCTMTNFFETGIFVGTDITEETGIHDFLIHGNHMETDSKSYAACLYIGANDQSDANFDPPFARYKYARITDNYCVIPRDIYPGEGSFFDGGAEAGAIQAFNLEDSVIDGNVTDGGTYGITTGFLRRVVISNNTCTGWRGAGIEVAWGIDGVAVTGNVIDGDGAGGPYNQATGLQDPLGLIVQTGAGIISSLSTSCINYTIAGNTITGFTTPATVAGILLYNQQRPDPGGTFENVTITGNTISAEGGTVDFAGVSVYAPTTNLTITGNTVDGYSRTPSYGVSIFEDTHSGMSIVGNNFSNMVSAAVNLSGTFTDVLYTGNLTRNCASGLSGNGVATATRLVLDNDAPATFTATAAGITTLTLDSTEVQVFTGTTTQNVRLPTTRVLAGRRFTIINNSTGIVGVQSSAGTALESLRKGTAVTCVALQNTPTAQSHWITTASGQSATMNRLIPFTGTSQSNLFADGPDTNIAVNVYSKGAGEIRFRNLAAVGTTFFAGAPVVSGVNWLVAGGAATGNAPYLLAGGTDTNVTLNLRSKGTGVVQANGVALPLNSITSVHTAQQIELGHATDTTVSRTSAGQIAVEGNPVGIKVAVPATAGATGVVGQWAAESGYLYICVAANTWERVAIATW